MDTDSSIMKIRGHGWLRWETQVFQLSLKIHIGFRYFWQSRISADQIPQILSEYLRVYQLELEDQGITQRPLSPTEFDCLIRSECYETLRKVGQELEAGIGLPPGLKVSVYLGSGRIDISKEQRVNSFREAYDDAKKKAETLADLMDKELVDVLSVIQDKERYNSYGHDLLSEYREPAKDVSQEVILEVTFKLGQKEAA